MRVTFFSDVPPEILSLESMEGGVSTLGAAATTEAKPRARIIESIVLVIFELFKKSLEWIYSVTNIFYILSKIGPIMRCLQPERIWKRIKSPFRA